MRDDLRLMGLLLRRTGRLIWRYGPALALIWLAGDLAQSILREVAVQIGLHARLGGIAVVTLTILVRLLVYVAMFRLLARDMMAPREELAITAPAPAAPVVVTPAPTTHGRSDFASDAAMLLVPFFAYYAAWGFLHDAIRAYAMAAIEADPLFEQGPILQVPGGVGAAIWVAAAWGLRRWAKARQKDSPSAIWPMLVVVGDAMWVFLGLYVLSAWRGDAARWLAEIWDRLSLMVEAARLPTPTDRPVETSGGLLRSLGYYALLPLVWFNLAAIIRGYDVHEADRLAAPAVARWQGLPKGLRDFLGPFFVGVVKRWHAVARGVRITLSAGVALTVAVVVGFRLIDWASGWAMRGTEVLIAPLETLPARVVLSGLEIAFGTARNPGDGLIAQVLIVCLLSAALDVIGARQGEKKGAPA